MGSGHKLPGMLRRAPERRPLVSLTLHSYCLAIFPHFWAGRESGLSYVVIPQANCIHKLSDDPNPYLAEVWVFVQAISHQLEVVVQ